MTIAKKKARALVWLAYGTSLIFALIFGFSSSAFIGYVCAGNYAIFHLVHPLGGYYFAYYYSWLFVGVGLSLFYSLQAQKKVREALVLQICGYLSILLPTGIVNAINPQTIYGIPSIMCGFAIIYAITLAIGIVPATQEL
jgi:Na+-driven multidrug efflux pump